MGDLKKVLSNLKTRGILGELQLGAILEEILAPEQYDTNVVTKPGSGQPDVYKRQGLAGLCINMSVIPACF